jgi:nitrogen fixation/metabolism regulation signal transduction histidine kinase
VRALVLYVAAAVLLVGVIGFIAWMNRHRRFRSRLTAVFLLFVAIPTIPLTLITAILLTRSVQIFLPDPIGEALYLSLDCIRFQIENRGERFLASFPDEKKWHESALTSSGIHSLCLFRIGRDTSVLVRSVQSAETSPSEIPCSHQEISQRFRSGRTSRLIEYQGREWFLFFESQPDSSLLIMKYPVDPKLADAHRHIHNAQIMVNTLSLFRESIIQKNLIWASAFIIIIGFLMLAWIISYRLSREMTGPIQALVGGMEQVAAGDLSHQIKAKAKDEFQYMIARFNAMTRDLKRTNEHLIQAERLAAWQSVARQISHEIKNSITPISLAIHRLKKQLGPSSTQKMTESIRNIEEEIGLLKNMAAEFSDFARLPESVREKMNINEIVQSAFNLNRNSWNHIAFHLSLSEHLPEIEADRNQIKRMINNLLKNAAESIENRGDIWVRTETQGDNKLIQLIIRDNGKGMDKDTIRKVFQPYFTTKKQGTGLGMAMVHQIVETHHGSIHIDSAPGQGTSIIIRFPVQP